MLAEDVTAAEDVPPEHLLDALRREIHVLHRSLAEHFDVAVDRLHLYVIDRGPGGDLAELRALDRGCPGRAGDDPGAYHE